MLTATIWILSIGAVGPIIAMVNYLINRDVYGVHSVNDRKMRSRAAHVLKKWLFIWVSLAVWPLALMYWSYVLGRITGRFFMKIAREFQTDLNATWD
jgi:hypothetical protein